MFSIEAPSYDEVGLVIRAAIEGNLGSVHRSVNDLAGQAALAAT
ncbi:hypothetical protein [Lacipirellula parvula]|uniref:Uncharacterized protein n=1 Tax=Lacipirellula parvula TaxID=2650471 RepID=A0A5K7XFC4_9BACT|nr:hypothetical protein [Lacipirellula parvula]BBO34737.1 hypothetical protein PLANPX_4349 [Lacipirellula parvula]